MSTESDKNGITVLPIHTDGRLTSIESGAAYERPVELAAGDFLRILARQEGADVVLRLVAPDGSTASEVDSPNGGAGSEELLYLAGSRGGYRVSVVAPSATPEGAGVRLEIPDHRQATDRDREMVANHDREGWANTRLGEYDAHSEAVSVLQSVLATWARLGEPARAAKTQFSLCRFYVAESKNELALAHCEQSLETFRPLGDTFWIALTASRMGTILLSLGRVRQALPLFEESVEGFRSLGLQREEALALTYLGTAHHRLGNLRPALACFEKALPAIESAGSPVDLAGALMNQGSLLLALNRPVDSLELYRRAEAVFGRMGRERSRAEVLHRMSQVALRVGDLAESESALEEGFRVLGELQDEQAVDRDLAISYLARGRLEARRGDFESARAAARESARFARQAGERQVEGAAILDLGRRYLQGGDSEAALEHLDRALEILVAAEDRTGEAMARIRNAQAMFELGRLLDAWRMVEPALDIVRELRTASDRVDFRTDYFSYRQEFFEIAVDILMARHREEPEAGHHVKALEIHESRRARELLDALGSLPDAEAGIPAELLDEERRLSRELRGAVSGGAVSVSGPRSEIEPLIDRLRDVRGKIRAASQQPGRVPPRKSAGYEEIRELLVEEGTRLVVYSLGDRQSYAWWIGPEGVESKDLGPRVELESLAREFAEHLPHLAGRKQQIRARLGQYLSESLLSPLASSPATRRLVIVADGDLQRIPFAALPMPGGKNREDYLVRHLEVVTLPSLSTLALQRLRAPEPPSELWIAAFGDPVFEASDSRVGEPAPASERRSVEEEKDPIHGDLRSASLRFWRGNSGREGFRRLEFSRQEIEAIRELVPEGFGYFALGFEASREACFAQPLDRFRVLHFATHAFQDPDHPELSGLVLSLIDPKGTTRQGFLHAFEVSRMHIPADLVVLSACDTGRGKSIPGEGVMGLTRAFLDAGAKRVVSSLWSVGDRSTAGLMTEFYESYFGRGEPPAAALRGAQLALLNEESTREPFHWAGFVFQGEWRGVRPETESLD